MEIIKKSILPFLLITQTSTLAFAQVCKELFSGPTLFTQSVTDDFQPVKLQIKGNFSEALERKQAEDPYGDSAENALFVEGSLVDTAKPQQAYKIKMKARGHSVLTDDVNFPKLKIEIDATENIKDSLFSGSRNFRINTHLNTASDAVKSGRGRVLGDNGPWREGLAYKLADILGLMTPMVSLAKVEYINTTDAKSEAFTRNALLIETDSKLVKRVKGRVLDTFSEIESAATPVIKPTEAALFFLYHKMIGNEDVQLRYLEPETMESERYRVQWNTYVVELPNKEKKPVVYDLDLATLVTGQNLELAKAKINSHFNLNDPALALYMTRFMQIRMKIGHADLLSAIQLMKEKQQQIEKLISNSPVDVEGKLNALAHIKMFFDHVDAAMAMPVLASENIHFYKTAKGAKEKTAESLPLRPGTPIKIIEDAGSRLKVAIMDIHGDLATGETVVGYINKDAKIQQMLPLELVGLVDERDR